MSRLPILGLPESDQGRICGNVLSEAGPSRAADRMKSGIAATVQQEKYLISMEIIDIPQKPYIIGLVKIS